MAGTEAEFDPALDALEISRLVLLSKRARADLQYGGISAAGARGEGPCLRLRSLTALVSSPCICWCCIGRSMIY